MLLKATRDMTQDRSHVRPQTKSQQIFFKDQFYMEYLLQSQEDEVKTSNRRKTGFTKCC